MLVLQEYIKLKFIVDEAWIPESCKLLTNEYIVEKSQLKKT